MTARATRVMVVGARVYTDIAYPDGRSERVVDEMGDPEVAESYASLVRHLSRADLATEEQCRAWTAEARSLNRRRSD